LVSPLAMASPLLFFAPRDAVAPKVTTNNNTDALALFNGVYCNAG
jgi:hypothetical protein